MGPDLAIARAAAARWRKRAAEREQTRKTLDHQPAGHFTPIDSVDRLAKRAGRLQQWAAAIRALP
ncbi:hypothetical protein, partial [Rhodospirillum rubrum]|uniref:hypothetical protein n=1 Tax=Rhodospirillum rubrum TaxID=1085 RepID=UPI001F5B30FB